MKSVVTHSGTFHPDDVFAIAILKLIYPDVKVLRSRDEKVFKQVDARVDVGAKYNFDTLDFDHHQPGGAATRENGIPYASAGLVWKHFGHHLVSDEDLVESLDKKLFQFIDADDNGVKIYSNLYDISPYTVGHVVNSFKPLWKEEKPDIDAAFFRAVNFAMELLKKEIEIVNAKYEAKNIVLSYIEEAQGKEYIVLKRYLPYQKTVRENSDAKYAVYQNANGDYIVYGVLVGDDTFEIRKMLPESWAGLRDGKLSEVTGVQDALFCHKDRFICGAKSFEGAIKLAELAVKN